MEVFPQPPADLHSDFSHKLDIMFLAFSFDIAFDQEKIKKVICVNCQYKPTYKITPSTRNSHLECVDILLFSKLFKILKSYSNWLKNFENQSSATIGQFGLVYTGQTVLTVTRRRKVVSTREHRLIA